MTKEEQAILTYFIDTMENNGVKHTLITIDFDDATLSSIQEKHHVTINSNNKHNLLNKLLSHEYIQYSYFGSQEYSGMQITSKGVGVINSIKAKEEQLKKRSFLKKLSDSIESHKGLATFVGAMIAIITLILKVVECK
jgi:hypothetical protein